MILNTIVKAIKRDSHRGDQAVTTDQITTDIVAAVDEAVRELQLLIPKRFWHKKGTPLSVTAGVAGTPAVYSLASDVHDPIAFHFTLNSQYYRLKKIDSDREWIESVWDPTAATGVPRVYREIGLDSSGYKQIEIFPIPNATISLNYEYYKLRSAALSTADLATEIPNFPDYLQSPLIHGGRYHFLKGFDDEVGLRRAESDYEKAKLALEIDDEQDQDSDIAFRFQGQSKEETGSNGLRIY